MSEVLINEQYLHDIANAIRIKNGENNNYYPTEMASAIMRITASEGVKFISKIDLKDDWKFNLISSITNPSYTSTSEAQPQYDDSEWTNISIPHDWSIEQDFDSSSPSGYKGGFLNGGDAWYRKSLPNLSYLAGKRLILYFDGVYMESDIYINGTLRKSNKNWYDPFWLDITNYLNFNSNNLLAVFIRNQQPSAHWYSGSGIFRDVSLLVCEPSSISIKNIIVTTPNLATEVGNDVTTRLRIDLVSSEVKTTPIKVEIIKDGIVVGSKNENLTVSVGDNQTTIDVLVNNPDLWDIGEGNLYNAKVTIGSGNAAIYHTVTFGYRYFEFVASTGFWLNGQNIKIKGICIHDTYGCLGAKINKSAIERELDILVEMGCNAIRTAHNAYCTELLTLCAERGILVFAEFFDCWTHRKDTYDFGRYFTNNYVSLITNIIRRDVNNPAIIMWGAGNEIINATTIDGDYTQQEATSILQNIINTIHALDTTRPITMGDNTPNSNVSRACMALLDVIGVNYGSDSAYNSLFSAFPNKSIFGSEAACAYMIRGDYTDQQTSNYDDAHPNWGDSVSDMLHRHMDNPKLAGVFPWIGVDYLGEARPFAEYPYRSSPKGALDTALFKKDAFYLYQSVWSDKPMIHIIPMHWDWTAGTSVTVWLYSNCASVDLWLNGTNLGSTTKGSKYQYAYTVPFTQGTLVANGYDAGGNLIAQDIIFSSRGMANKLSLATDKTTVDMNSDDLVFVTCEVQDENGVVVPTANNTITFSAIGGTIVGTDSGWVKDVENMTSNSKKASFGKLLCVVKPDQVSGDLVVTAASTDLISGTVTIQKTNVTTKSIAPTQTFIDASNPPMKNYL